MKKIISFSLWGDIPMYNDGAIQNVKIAKLLFPEWICRFYIGTNTDKHTVEELKKHSNVEIINMNIEATMKSMIWRFHACADDDVSVVLSRDTDCRLSERELESVNMWLDSDKDFHIIRDHPYHNAPIMGGMWGARNKILKNIKELLHDFESTNTPDRKQYDQIFLGNIIYNIVKNKCFVNDVFFERKNKLKTPRDRNGVYFIGEIFNHDGTYHSDEHRRLVDQYESTN
jgi:hypothetical protein